MGQSPRRASRSCRAAAAEAVEPAALGAGCNQEGNDGAGEHVDAVMAAEDAETAAEDAAG